jgi:hypothetical protein
MNEEPVNNCNPENQHPKAENARVPNNTGRESTEYNLGFVGVLHMMKLHVHH